MAQRRERNSGQELVEFAIVFPVLMLLLLGIIEFGRIVYSYNAISNAAREGARLAILPANQDEILDVVDQRIRCPDGLAYLIIERVCDRAMAIDRGQTWVTVSQPDPRIVQIEVEYEGGFLTNLVLQAVNRSGLHLQATATMRLE